MSPSSPDINNIPPNAQSPNTTPIEQNFEANNNQATAKDLAEAQAQILAKAILEAQKMATNLPRPQSAPQQPIPPLVNQHPIATPNNISAQNKKQESVSRGERVIQPLHTAFEERGDSDMQKRMEELLGGGDFTPEQINTKTAKNINTPRIAMNVPNATQASESIPTPQAAQPAQISANTDYREVYAQGYQQQHDASRTILTQMQTEQARTPQQYQVPQNQDTQPSMDPMSAAIRSQQLRAEEDRQEQYYQQLAARELQLKAAERARAEAQELARQQEIARQKALAEQKAQDQARLLSRNNIRVNKDVVTKAAAASTLNRQNIANVAPEPVQAIQPAYISQLESDLAGDMQKKDKMNAMQRAMAAELADDEITLEAKKIKPNPNDAKEGEYLEIDNTPKEVLAAIRNISSTNILPNQSTTPETTEINADLKHDR